MLREQFPAARQVETRSLHRGLPQAHHSFLPMSQGEDRMQRLHLVSRLRSTTVQSSRGRACCAPTRGARPSKCLPAQHSHVGHKQESCRCGACRCSCGHAAAMLSCSTGEGRLARSTLSVLELWSCSCAWWSWCLCLCLQVQLQLLHPAIAAQLWNHGHELACTRPAAPALPQALASMLASPEHGCYSVLSLWQC